MTAISAMPDEMPVVEPRAAGIDGHKMQVTVSVHLCEPGRGTPLACTATFGTDPQALAERVRWLRVHGVGVATIECPVV